MGPKKKSKSNKLASMSEEERLRYLQHRAAMEEEAHRRKQQIIATFINIKLKHEQAFTRLNLAKINQQWRHILRQIKCKELKEEIEDLQQHYNCIVSNKNELIRDLLSDFDRAEFQYSLQFQEHVETMSRFLKLHRERLLNLHDWYTKQLEKIREKNTKSRKSMLETIHNDVTNIMEERENSSEQNQEKIKNIESVYTEKKNDLQTKLLYRSVKMEEKYADDLEQLQQEYNTVLQQYKQNTESKLAHYKILSEKDNAYSADIIRYYEKMRVHSNSIENKKTRLINLRNECENEKNHFTATKAKVLKELNSARQQLEQNYKTDKLNLKFLINTSNLVINDLKDVLKDGNQLLQIMNQCKQLAEEKDVEFSCQDGEENFTDSTFLVLNRKLHTFWKVQSTVKLRNESLNKEKAQAQEENKKLRKLLHYYMSSIRRSHSVPRKCGF